MYTCVLILKKGIDVYGSVHWCNDSAFFANALVKSPVCDSMRNEQAPHRLYATQDMLDKLVISSTMCS